MYRPPSIQTLRALEAAARLRSFSRAAEELGVTHGAVSHRIREIEERLGAVMFERRGNTMEPTAAARQVLPVIRQSLELIASVFPAPAHDGQQVLRIGVLPSFAANWLVPRLAAFHAAHPKIAIALDPRLEVSPIGPGGLDAAIRYGSGQWPDLTTQRMIVDMVFPACSPHYRRHMEIHGPQDFARCHLMRNVWQPWTPWLQKAGIAMAEPTGSVPFEDAGLMLDAAVAGQGVALVRKVIARDAIAEGRLVRLSDIEIPFEGAYHFAWSRIASDKDAAIRSFGVWLAQQLHQEFPD
ncbi:MULTISPECIES: LysR substrate-binding domain-containing protein [unclassified Novosphingobium]|uniref:LysR substrate-binding domain-containing protein n=1 Tax=unclassified Novosphingobium TaxID=2644732 RepID=UPI001357A62C|nr:MULTISPECIES: LysR substrate-binding domain-containing protein [unclassified Novosphingobium]